MVDNKRITPVFPNRQGVNIELLKRQKGSTSVVRVAKIVLRRDKALHPIISSLATAVAVVAYHQVLLMEGGINQIVKLCICHMRQNGKRDGKHGTDPGLGVLSALAWTGSLAEMLDDTLAMHWTLLRINYRIPLN